MGINISIGNLISKGKVGKTLPFDSSLVDYWSFAGRSNNDANRDIITGVKGNILNAYNFIWELGSGYGQYLVNYRTYSLKANNAVIKLNSYNTFTIMESKDINPFFFKDNGDKAYKIRVSGIEEIVQGLIYIYGMEDENQVYIDHDGEYELPAGDMAEFQTIFVGKCKIVVEQIPNYQGAIVTDGVTSHLKLNKTGYKVRTVIIKFKPINIKPNIVNSIVNIHTDEVALQYDTSGVLNNNFTTYKNYGEYSVGTFNIDKNAVTPLTLGCKLSNSGRSMEYSNIAIYDIAIYSKVLTNEQILSEIELMKQLK